ncbi:DGQHR domain-containing protein [Mitsuaria sp. GD03876]|uniref:DGQHR domain-containing protein n=1 Tax=Mitsuaria sp. GD03876 TaxID=2975399 RepID=UPI00244B5222|nr:DGQHR domain-containing protein [Mitsuaria sp. GD03876]MDH0863505.1 DGQHR domain-containing protein [Mitsuaria sp. GD03876]
MTKRTTKPLLRVNQWLTSWNQAQWGDERPRPPTHFFVGSISLKALRQLSGVRTRTVEDRRENSSGTGYQRSHDQERLNKIGRYVEYGFPLSTQVRLNPEEHRELINPGWLPTAILVNVIGHGESRPRRGKDRFVDAKHLVTIAEANNQFSLEFPESLEIDQDNDLAPLEIIDGQHRLLASDEVQALPADYEVPIVIFNRLPLNWQAYLFWVINVEPKRINTSLAFDLYPDLRDQEWLQRGESVKIYQEHRSQELAEILWKHPQSPWRDRVELFGKRVDGHVSNAAVIRSLMATFVRPFAKTDSETDEVTKVGGLFGSIDRLGKSYVIKWRRPEQAAFLILAWTAVKEAVGVTSAAWKKALADELSKRDGGTSGDFAFSGTYTLLGTDQGFRAICFAFNSLAQMQLEHTGLLDIESQHGESEPSEENIARAISDLSKNRPLAAFLRDIAKALVDGVDWRTSAAPGLLEVNRVQQAQYRGSSGYTALNRAAINAAAQSKSDVVRAAANDVRRLQGWQS